MDEDDNLPRPIATSTAWKKDKPENWNEAQDLTFSAPEINSQNLEDGKVISPFGESTMNLGKYLIPSHPAQLEEDNLLPEPQYFDEGGPRNEDELLTKLHQENEVMQDNLNFSITQENLIDTSISHYFKYDPALDISDENSSVQSASALKLACPMDSCEVFENPEKLRDDDVDDSSESAIGPEVHCHVPGEDDLDVNEDKIEGTEDSDSLDDGLYDTEKELESASSKDGVAEKELESTGVSNPDEKIDSTEVASDKLEETLSYVNINQVTDDDNEVEASLEGNVKDSASNMDGNTKSFEDNEAISEDAVCDMEKCVISTENNDKHSDDSSNKMHNVDDDTIHGASSDYNSEGDIDVPTDFHKYVNSDEDITESCNHGNSNDADASCEDDKDAISSDNEDEIIDRVYLESDYTIYNNILSDHDLCSVEHCREVSTMCVGASESPDDDKGLTVSEVTIDSRDNSVDSSGSPDTKKETSSPVTPQIKPKIGNHDDIVQRILIEDKTPKYVRNSYHYHSILDKINEMSEPPGVLFPSTCTIDTPSIIGISKKFGIAIQNNTTAWVQCVLSFDKLSQDAGFSCQKKFILQPSSTEELMFTYTPVKEGLATATLEIEIDSVTTGLLPTQNGLCKITCFAESPKLIINPDDIKFGTLVSCKESTFRIKNLSSHELPIKIMLLTEGCEEAFDLSDPKSSYATSFIKLSLAPSDVFIGYIQFSPHVKYLDCYGHIQVYLDSPNKLLLKQIPISGTVGLYKLKIHNSKRNIRLETKPGVPCSTRVPFIYDGNLPATLRLSAPTAFNINPTYIPDLTPGETGEFEVIYFPTTIEKVGGKLLMDLGDGDTQYDITLTGISSPNVPNADNDKASALLANKTVVNFGGAKLGYRVETEIILKNDLPAKIICIELQIKSKSKCFFMLKGDEYSLCCDIVLPAGSSRTIRLGFTAFTLSQHEGELVISSKDKKITHTIPLTGYGGVAEISLQGVQQTSSHLWVEMGVVQANQRNTTCITLTNTGNIPAFVKGLLESTEGYPLSSKLGWVNPSSLVIGPGSTRDIFIVFEPRDTSFDSRLASLKLYYGDEISRQRYCKVVNDYSISYDQIKELPFDPTVEFLIPSNIPPMIDVKVPKLQRLNVNSAEERKLFENGMKQLFVSIMSSKRSDSLVGGNVLTETRKHSENSLANNSMSTTDSWSLSTNEIYLRGRETSFTILNDSPRLIEVKNIVFDEEFVDVTPKKGTIKANGGLEIYVEVKDMKAFVTTLAVSSFGRGEKYLTIYHQPSTDTDNQQQTIVFDTVPVRQTSTSCFEFRNINHSSVSWNVMSVGAPYRKADLEPSNVPDRVTYSVFCFKTVKGTVLPGQVLSVPISFAPQSPGVYNQVWEFSYCARTDQNVSGRHRQRLILSGTSVMPEPSPIRSIASSSSRLSNRSTSSTLASSHQHKHNDVYLKTAKLFFRAGVFQRNKQNFKLSNPLREEVTVVLHPPRQPFHCKYNTITIKPEHSVTVPMKFEPKQRGVFFDAIGIDTKYERLLLPLCGNTTET